VHSGARPPWLDTASSVDTTVQSSAVIGPTADDLQKHCMLFDFVIELLVGCRRCGIYQSILVVGVILVYYRPVVIGIGGEHFFCQVYV